MQILQISMRKNAPGEKIVTFKFSNHQFGKQFSNIIAQAQTLTQVTFQSARHAQQILEMLIIEGNTIKLMICSLYLDFR